MKEEEFDEIVEELSDEEENEIMGGKTTSTVSTVHSLEITCTEKTCRVRTRDKKESGF